MQTEVTVPKAPWVMSPVEKVDPEVAPATMSAGVGVRAAGDDPATVAFFGCQARVRLRSRNLEGTPETASGVGSCANPCRAWALVRSVLRASSARGASPTLTFGGSVRLSEVCICEKGVMPATGEAPKENPKATAPIRRPSSA